MLHLEEDMRTVFFGSDFAARFRRHRAGELAREVVGIVGTVDDEALEGRVFAASRTLRYPADCELRADDVLECLDEAASQGIKVGTRFRVLEAPRRVNDGAEMEALLGSVPA
ncbi:hypothetical protein [Paracidovorax wautersii]|uniref:Uncharacterized protein n=1 Tax=Paracidovorax wautersii TaxID=1177982 RepID=A0A1I2GBD4_9BURK|nr:hypothetical protein [Paracidovorax wautersii]SFF14822.1 hypothetical protein SAMN04489711_11464 [Paracidovorax wautersii]